MMNDPLNYYMQEFLASLSVNDIRIVHDNAKLPVLSLSQEKYRVEFAVKYPTTQTCQTIDNDCEPSALVEGQSFDFAKQEDKKIPVVARGIAKLNQETGRAPQSSTATRGISSIAASLPTLEAHPVSLPCNFKTIVRPGRGRHHLLARKLNSERASIRTGPRKSRQNLSALREPETAPPKESRVSREDPPIQELAFYETALHGTMMSNVSPLSSPTSTKEEKESPRRPSPCHEILKRQNRRRVVATRIVAHAA